MELEHDGGYVRLLSPDAKQKLNHQPHASEFAGRKVGRVGSFVNELLGGDSSGKCVNDEVDDDDVEEAERSVADFVGGEFIRRHCEGIAKNEYWQSNRESSDDSTDIPFSNESRQKGSGSSDPSVWPQGGDGASVLPPERRLDEELKAAECLGQNVAAADWDDTFEAAAATTTTTAVGSAERNPGGNVRISSGTLALRNINTFPLSLSAAAREIIGTPPIVHNRSSNSNYELHPNGSQTRLSTVDRPTTSQMNYVRERYLSMLGCSLLLNLGYVPNLLPLISHQSLAASGIRILDICDDDGDYHHGTTPPEMRAVVCAPLTPNSHARFCSREGSPQASRMDSRSRIRHNLSASALVSFHTPPPGTERNANARATGSASVLPRSVMYDNGLECGTVATPRQSALLDDSTNEYDITAAGAAHGTPVTSTSCSFFTIGSVGTSVFNLTTSTLGAGALALPYAISKTGLLWGLSLLLGVGYLSYLATLFIVQVMNVTGLQTLEEMAIAVGGRHFAIFVEVNIILFSFGTAVGYLICVSDLAFALTRAAVKLFGVPGRAIELGAALGSISVRAKSLILACVPYGASEASRTSWAANLLLSKQFVLVLITLCILLPLSLSDKIGEMAFASFLGVSSICLLLVVVIAGLISAPFESTNLQASLYPASMADIIRVSPIIIFAFSCQANVPVIYCELENKNLRRMAKVTKRACALCFAIYAGIGLGGFLTWGSYTAPNILSNYSNQLGLSVPITVAFIGTAAAITVAYPMNIFPCRFSLEMMLLLNQPTSAGGNTRNLITFAVVGLSLLIASCVPSISVVFSLLGSTAAACVALIFPGLFFILLLPGSIFHPRKVKALLLVVSGSVAGVLGTSCAIRDMFVSA